MLVGPCKFEVHVSGETELAELVEALERAAQS
jgi:hypothetical protein